MATISEALEIAVDLHLAGRLDEAATIYRRIIDADPDHVRTLNLLGTLLCQQDRMAEARPFLEHAARLNPALAAVHLTLARIHARQGEWSSAAGRLRAGLAVDPASADLLDLLSVVERQQGRADGAVAALDRAGRILPQDGGLGERLGLLLYERGHRHLAERRNAAAVADLCRAVRLLPFHPDSAFALATALGETGRAGEACAAYRRVLVWSPAEPQALHNLGVTLLHDGRVADSTRLLRRAVAAAPHHAEPYEALTALFDRRDPAQAAFWSTRALALKLAAAGADSLEPAPAPATGPLRTRDIVSFSLWGGLEVYCAGAVANARSMPSLLPGWVCRFHHDDTVPPHILAELAALGAELVEMPAGTAGRQGMFWRFLAADDPTVRRFLCRDCDSRPTMREIAAVEEWIASGRPFHVMRDHVMHMEPVMGGMWGGTAGLLPPIGPEIGHFTASHTSRWNDQHFLAEWLWPRIAGSVLVHDGVHPGYGLPFPAHSTMAESDYVGAKLLHLLPLPATVITDHPQSIALAPAQDGPVAYPTDDPHIGRSLASLGEWLGIETAFCAGLLAAQGADLLALDLDAGIGVHALALAAAADAPGRVLAWEARPALNDCLRRTAAANRQDRLTVGEERAMEAEISAALQSGGRPGLVRAALSRFSGATGSGLVDGIVRSGPALYLRVEEGTGIAAAIRRLQSSGYRLWWHLAPVFNPGNRLGTWSNPFPGLVTVNLLGVPSGRPVPSGGSLVPVGEGGADWRAAAWHLRCDGR